MPPYTCSLRTCHAMSSTRAARIAPARFRLGRCWRHREPDADAPRLAGRRFMARQAMITVRHAPADNDGETIARNVESHPALAEQHLPVAAENDAAPVSPLATVWTPRRRRGTERPATLASADRFAGARLMPESIRFAMSPGADLRSGLGNSAASSASNARGSCKGSLQQSQFGKALPAFAIAQAGKLGSMPFQESQHCLRGCPTVVSERPADRLADEELRFAAT